MNRFIAMAILCLPLSQCRSSQFIGPNGEKAFEVTCNGIFKSMANCYKSAGAKCRGGYDVIQTSREITGFDRDYNGNHSVTNDRSLMFSCKNR